MNSQPGDQSPAAPAALQEARWAAVVARDRAADGRFWYSVATTGVYCRPSCPARRPKPGNVRFHTSTADAEAAGFRPCKRCRPDRPAGDERLAATIVAACRTIATAEEAPKLAALAAAAGLPPTRFRRAFKALTGVTPKAYATARRTLRLHEGLAAGATVTEAIYDAGFNTASRFYAASNSTLGMTPGSWRAGGDGAEIRFAVGECRLGSTLVATTTKGVCAILLGDDAEALLRELQDRFPRAALVGGDAGFEAMIARVVGFVEAPHLGLDLPLDVRGTAFQHRVWQELRNIPCGGTASYAEIARRIGAPDSARAVGGACAANPVALAIPCHRVVRTDGSVSGYRWGIERKRALLRREASDK